LNNVMVTLTAGGVEVTGHTERGQALLDVSAIASAFTDPQNADVELQDGDKRVSAQVSLANAPAYATWKKGVEDREASVRSQEAAAQAKRDEEEAIRAHTANLNALLEVEAGLAEVGPPWTSDRMARFEHLAHTAADIVVVTMTAAEKTHLKALGARIDALVPSFKHAANLQTFENVERGLAQLTPNEVTDDQLVFFQQLLSTFKSAYPLEETAPTERDKARVAALLAKIERLAPIYDQALADARARQAQARQERQLAAVEREGFQICQRTGTSCTPCQAVCLQRFSHCDSGYSCLQALERCNNSCE
jgi:hypothetical protein